MTDRTLKTTVSYKCVYPAEYVEFSLPMSGKTAEEVQAIVAEVNAETAMYEKLKEEIREKGYVVEMYKALWLCLYGMDNESEAADKVRDMLDPFEDVLTNNEHGELEHWFLEVDR